MSPRRENDASSLDPRRAPCHWARSSPPSVRTPNPSFCCCTCSSLGEPEDTRGCYIPTWISLSPLSNSFKKLVACSCCAVNALNLFEIIPMRKLMIILFNNNLIHSNFCSRAVQNSELVFVGRDKEQPTDSSSCGAWPVSLFMWELAQFVSLSIYLCSVHVEDPSRSPPLSLATNDSHHLQRITV